MEYLGIDFSCALGSLRDGKIPEKDCLLPLISKLLGYCIVAASTTVKLPQARISTYIIQILVYFSFNLNNLVFEFSYLIANLGFDLISAWDLGIVIVTFKINHRECLGLGTKEHVVSIFINCMTNNSFHGFKVSSTS